MKLLKTGLALTMVGVGLAAMPSLGAQASPAPAGDPLLTQLRNQADDSVVVNRQAATGKAGFVRTEGDLMPGKSASDRASAIAKAGAYLAKYAPAFGARASELGQTEVYADRAGWSVTFAQSYQGVPVFAAELKAHVDREGDLTSVNGFAAPALSLSVTPGITREAASARALDAVKAKPAGHEDGLPAAFAQGLTVRSADLMIYRMGSTRGIQGEAKLAWVVEVWNKSTIRETLILDAASGKPLNRWSMLAHALDRELYEARQDFSGYDHVWSEGDPYPAPGMTEDQQNEVRGAGEAYWMFRNTFGYNSWDGNGAKMITVNNDPRIDCPNANWNGVTTNYCSGVTGDDTVAHEWGHAYTESTSGLIYQWQAGAMNEAYSDIWGETVDMLNTRHNEVGEENSTGGSVPRSPGNCSQYTRSLTTMEITAPAEIAGPCVNIPASFGPVITETPVNATAVVGTDAANPAGPTTTDGCSPLNNAAEIDGIWVYVDRGTCPFADKIENAENAGAIGIVVGNTPTGALGSIAGDSDLYGVMVSNADGTKFKSAGEPVQFTIAAEPSDADPTHRWLSGETDPAFGGAIRDMWNPNCYGDPGKVSDEEYVCGSEDSGGVHSNSGVVNRTFALLVDGMDGQGTGIGLDKAARLFWHTQTNYLTPSSYFPDLANGLEASCAAMQGINFEEVTLGDPSDPDGSDGGVVEPELVIGGTTAEDCAKVTAVIAETELRLDPTELCDWQPLLAPGAPALTCGTGTVTKATYTEDFEDGLAGWTQDEEIGFPAGSGIAWESSTAAPGGHAGGVAFGPDPVAGECSGEAGDLTSRNGLISPAITVPAGTTPRISFEHYMASEATWDGGNVKVSVNGGAFTLVPEDAYLFNAPAGELDPDAGPMGGEPAWTGTDGGKLAGSWGTSVIDLGKLAAAGASVKFRFDMGRDGCNGVDGWYVDNVKVEVCESSTTPTPTPTTTPTPTPTPSVKAETTTKVKVKPAKIQRGDAFKIIVKVRSAAGEVTGKVKIMLDGKKIAKLRLDDGRAVKKVKRMLAVGKHKVVAKYLGSDDFKRSKDDARLRVIR